MVYTVAVRSGRCRVGQNLDSGLVLKGACRPMVYLPCCSPHFATLNRPILKLQDRALGGSATHNENILPRLSSFSTTEFSPKREAVSCSSVELVPEGGSSSVAPKSPPPWTSHVPGLSLLCFCFLVGGVDSGVV